MVRATTSVILHCCNCLCTNLFALFSTALICKSWEFLIMSKKHPELLVWVQMWLQFGVAPDHRPQLLPQNLGLRMKYSMVQQGHDDDKLFSITSWLCSLLGIFVSSWQLLPPTTKHDTPPALIIQSNASDSIVVSIR